MSEKYTVAIIGCGRLGQHYAEVYQTLPNTELIAIAEYNPERRKVVGELRRPRALGPQRVDERADVAPQEAVRDRAGRRRRHLEPPEALQGDR